MDDVSNASPKPLSKRLLPLLIIAGVLVNTIFLISLRERWMIGLNDYMGFYSSGKLAFTGKLYDFEEHWRIQRAATANYGTAWIFVRFPYYAILLWPFAQLPYLWAWAAFTLASLGSVWTFLTLWPGLNRREALALALACLPLCHSFLNGQDVAFLLLWLTLGIYLLTKEMPFSAGLMLSLVAAKPHLFLFLPLVLAYRRQWRVLAGLATGAAGLFVLSILVAGPEWIQSFVKAISTPVLHDWHQMPNLELYTGPQVPAKYFYALGIPIFSALLYLARNQPLPLLIALSIVPAILLAPHVYLADCALLLPLGLMLLNQKPLAAYILLSPMYIALPYNPPAAYIVPVLILIAWLISLQPSRPFSAPTSSPA